MKCHEVSRSATKSHEVPRSAKDSNELPRISKNYQELKEYQELPKNGYKSKIYIRECIHVPFQFPCVSNLPISDSSTAPKSTLYYIDKIDRLKEAYYCSIYSMIWSSSVWLGPKEVHCRIKCITHGIVKDTQFIPRSV